MRGDSLGIGSDSEVQNWTAEIIATSADALAVNPRLWPAICHSELGAIRYGGFLPMCDAAWSGGAESFASTPLSVFSMPEAACCRENIAGLCVINK